VVHGQNLKGKEKKKRKKKGYNLTWRLLVMLYCIKMFQIIIIMVFYALDLSWKITLRIFRRKDTKERKKKRKKKKEW
jgi:hypothetical protein